MKANDVILELGGGSGNVTQHLINRYYNKDVKIVFIEKPLYFADVLKKRFEQYPKVQIIEGDATKLNSLLPSTSKISGKGIKFKEYRFTIMLHRDHEIKSMEPEKKIYLINNFIITAEINTLYYPRHSDNNDAKDQSQKDNKKDKPKKRVS
ncbi:dimethyladenosine transferase [Candidatus Phytoplasma pruni]|uniref:Dimethyladenosine transferase n=1 Tax=Candidatus Phytoplasma pruni TaxID=479893 RepID=A0A0M1MZV2_9MOLU|nr:dimethyladenosine transferase [Candidatus Phytoplasma pruni]